MAANVLNSPRAIQMAVFVVRAFLKMRALLGDKREKASSKTCLAGKGIEEAAGRPRSRHRYHFTTCDGHNRSTSSAKTTEAPYWFYTITDRRSRITALAMRALPVTPKRAKADQPSTISPLPSFPYFFPATPFVTFQLIRKGNALTTILPLRYTYYYDYEISCPHFYNRLCQPLRCARSITHRERVARCVALTG